MWIKYNPNPRGNSRAGDCVIRGITKLTGKLWEDVYTELSIYGYSFGDWGNSNAVFDAYLRDQGYKRSVIPNTCIKLAAYLTIKQSMLKSPHEKTEDVYGLSYAPATDIVSYDSGTEFSDKINGKPINEILDLMDELMSTLQELNPKLYASVMRRL